MNTIEYVDPPQRTEPVTTPLVTEKPEPTLLNRAERRQMARYIRLKTKAQMREVKRRKPWIADQAKQRCGRCHLYFLGKAEERCQCQVQQRHRCRMCQAELIASQQEYAVTNVCAGCGAALQLQWDNEEASRSAAYEEIGEAEMAVLIDEIGEEYDETLRALADL
jgi:hypothetical protein